MVNCNVSKMERLNESQVRTQTVKLFEENNSYGVKVAGCYVFTKQQNWYRLRLTRTLDSSWCTNEVQSDSFRIGRNYCKRLTKLRIIPQKTYIGSSYYVSEILEQEAQLSQRDRAAACLNFDKNICANSVHPTLLYVRALTSTNHHFTVLRHHVCT